MANPSSFTITDLTANSGATKPTFQAVDTNGTINCAAGSKASRLFFDMENADDAAVTVTIKGGTGIQAMQSKDTAFTLAASGSAGDKKFLGPFESSRVCKSDGSLDVTVLAATGAPNLNVRVLRLAKI